MVKSICGSSYLRDELVKCTIGEGYFLGIIGLSFGGIIEARIICILNKALEELLPMGRNYVLTIQHNFE